MSKEFIEKFMSEIETKGEQTLRLEWAEEAENCNDQKTLEEINEKYTKLFSELDGALEQELAQLRKIRETLPSFSPHLDLIQKRADKVYNQLYRRMPLCRKIVQTPNIFILFFIFFWVIPVFKSFIK